MENEIIVNGVTYVKKEEKKQSKRGNKYWYFCNGGEVEYGYNITDIDKALCYPTEAEATKARDKMLALYRIKEYCNEQWGEFIANWNYHSQGKYYIAYDHEENRYIFESNYYTSKSLPFYLEKEEHCKEIIEKFKDDLDILFDKKG